MTWWVVLASFVGAVIGAAIPAMVTLRGQHQQARTEWSQRLDRAITALTSDSPVARDIGWELLTDLIESDLGSPADRSLARRVSRATLTRSAVDESVPRGDNETDRQEHQS
jgi:hypothetical protein